MGGYDRVAEIGKALGHPTRLRILQVLRVEEACVCHLEAIIGQRQAHISQHLARLRDAGLVVDRRDGMNVFYSLATEDLGSLVDAVVNAAIAVAAVSGDKLSFAPLEHDVTDDCACPTCEAKANRFIRVTDVSVGLPTGSRERRDAFK